MDPSPERPDQTPIGKVPVRRPGRALELLWVLVAALVVLAIAKPWDVASPVAPYLPAWPVRPATAGPPPTADLSPEGVAEPVCLGTAGWRVTTIETWRLEAARPVAVALRRVAPTNGPTQFAALYREVTDCVGSLACSGITAPLLAQTWAAGRYVFQYADRGAGTTWWFGADVQVLPPPTQEPSPTTRPSG